jgi:thioredoxin reductase
MDDIIIIGGSFAGLAAATQLGRARRRVRVLDTGLPRNRFSPAAHGVLGHDGLAPGEILAMARAQLAAYPTVSLVPAAAAALSGSLDDFRVETTAHGTLSARRIILAHGVTDALPHIPGISECWGLSVLHCPYCHGFEFGDRALAYLASPGFELMAARLYRDWSSDIVMFSNSLAIDAETRAAILSLGVRINDAPVLALRHEAGLLTHIVTADGDVARDAIFVAPRTSPSADLYRGLGCALEAGFSGDFIKVDERQETSVRGVYAAGDLARPMHNVTFAMATGVMAGSMAHHSLLVAPAAPGGAA